MLMSFDFFNTIENLEDSLTYWYDTLDELINIVSSDPTSVTRVGVLINNAIINVTRPVGNALVVLFFFMGLFEASANMSEAKRPEAIVRLLVRTGVTGSLVEKGYMFVSRLLNIFQGLIGDFTAMYPLVNTTSRSYVPDDIKTAVEALGPIYGFGPWVVSLLGRLAIIVCAFIVLLTVYGRFVKIYMYMIISPIPLSTFAAKSTQQIGTQFVRNYCAVGLEGIIMVMAIWIYRHMQIDVLNSAITSYDPAASASSMVWSFLQTTIFNILVLITIIKTSNALAKEMFGV